MLKCNETVFLLSSAKCAADPLTSDSRSSNACVLNMSLLYSFPEYLIE